MGNEELWKMPPVAKVYEALGALADGRVQLDSPAHARVTSSAGDKVYDVESGADGRTIFSNDNASYWQGYLGYPAIAVMIARGLYRPDETVLAALRGIPWNDLNRRRRNNYERAIADVIEAAERAGHDPERIQAEAEAVIAAVRALAPLRGPHRRPPRAISK
ncbi:MAG: hypothetical protein ACREQ4_11500 [Candidatus Binataceae bacterium]